MVARITSGSSPAGALFYNKEKIDKERAYLLLCQNALMTTPSDGRLDMIRAMETFQPYLDVNQRTKKMVFHVSLNPAPEDKLTDAQLSEIAQVYMEKWGMGNNRISSSNTPTSTATTCISCRSVSTARDGNFRMTSRHAARWTPCGE